MKRMRNLIGLTLIVVLASCGSGNKVGNKESESIYKKWELAILDGKQIRENQPVYIELANDNTVSGFIGCNRVTGTFVIENKTQIRFKDLATTRMACPETEMELERQVLELLNTTDNFRLEEGKLKLFIGRRAALAEFQAMSDNEVVNKYWKLIKLNGKTVEMAENQEREQYFILKSDSSVTGFAGCNQFNGQYELSANNRIKFNENMAMTLKACPDVDIDESEMLKVFLQANKYTIKVDTLSLIADEGTLAVFEAVYF